MRIEQFLAVLDFLHLDFFSMIRSFGRRDSAVDADDDRTIVQPTGLKLRCLLWDLCGPQLILGF